MSTPALTTTIVATKTVPLTIPILVGYLYLGLICLFQSWDHVIPACSYVHHITFVQGHGTRFGCEGCRFGVDRGGDLRARSGGGAGGDEGGDGQGNPIQVGKRGEGGGGGGHGTGEGDITACRYVDEPGWKFLKISENVHSGSAGGVSVRDVVRHSRVGALRGTRSARSPGATAEPRRRLRRRGGGGGGCRGGRGGRQRGPGSCQGRETEKGSPTTSIFSIIKLFANFLSSGSSRSTTSAAAERGVPCCWPCATGATPPGAGGSLAGSCRTSRRRRRRPLSAGPCCWGWRRTGGRAEEMPGRHGRRTDYSE